MSNPYESKPLDAGGPATDWWDGYNRGFKHALEAARVTLFGIWLTFFLMLINLIGVVYRLFQNYQP